MLRPHADVVSAAQAGKPGDVVAHYLDTHRGSKGGRARMFAIDNAMRQGAIDYARCVVVGVNESVGDPSLSLQQAMRRLRYVMERFGVTRAGLGVVPHGLRHQGAADDYRAMTGELPPVAGGGAVERELDAQARHCIAERLGHGRRQIVNAYLGSRSATRPKAEADQETQRQDEQGDQA